MSRLWFCSTKGADERINITFISTVGHKRYFDAKRNFMGLKHFLENEVDTIVSIEYSIYRLVKVYPMMMLTDIKLINLKQMYKDLVVLDRDVNLDRKYMCERLGIDIFKFEPTYPSSNGTQTCNLYMAIYFRLRELSEF